MTLTKLPALAALIVGLPFGLLQATSSQAPPQAALPQNPPAAAAAPAQNPQAASAPRQTPPRGRSITLGMSRASR